MKKNAIELRFLDSCRFMSSSLEKLSGYSYLSDNYLLTVKSIYQTPNEFSLMKL